MCGASVRKKRKKKDGSIWQFTSTRRRLGGTMEASGTRKKIAKKERK